MPDALPQPGRDFAAAKSIEANNKLTTLEANRLSSPTTECVSRLMGN